MAVASVCCAERFTECLAGCLGCCPAALVRMRGTGTPAHLQLHRRYLLPRMLHLPSCRSSNVTALAAR